MNQEGQLKFGIEKSKQKIGGLEIAELYRLGIIS